MFGDPQMQQYSHEMDETDRPLTGEFGRLSKRLFVDVKELAGVAFVEGRRGTARSWTWLKAEVRSGPMRAAVIALCIGGALGYWIGRG